MTWCASVILRSFMSFSVCHAMEKNINPHNYRYQIHGCKAAISKQYGRSMEEILHQLIGSLYQYWQGLNIPGGCLGFLPSTIHHQPSTITTPNPPPNEPTFLIERSQDTRSSTCKSIAMLKKRPRPFRRLYIRHRQVVRHGVRTNAGKA